MNIAITAHIARPIDAVWRLLADDFTAIADWSTVVFTSDALTDATGAAGAPIAGRYCTFTEDPDGLAARETITSYDKANHVLAFHVQPASAGALPLRENHVVITLERVGPDETGLRWEAKPVLRLHGYPIYPFLKMGLTKGMRGVVEDFKSHAESSATRADG